jgi:uncharacterized protein
VTVKQHQAQEKKMRRIRSRAPLSAEPESREGLTARSVRPFFAITFALSWGIAALLVAIPERIEAIFGEMGYTNPAFVLAVYAPGITAVLMVGRTYGLTGLGRFLSRLTLWRMPLVWWAVLLLGMPAVFYAGAAISGTLTEPFPLTPWYHALPAVLIALVIGPVEELGWRGVALPLLQRRFTPLSAALVLGAVSAVWHLPAFVLGGTKQSAWAVGPFLLGVVAISVILTAMFNAARGSLLIAVLFHFQMNAPLWPDAQPWDIAVFVAVAAVVVLANRAAMLNRDGAATAVLMPGERPAGRNPDQEGRAGSTTNRTSSTRVQSRPPDERTTVPPDQSWHS